MKIKHSLFIATAIASLGLGASYGIAADATVETTTTTTQSAGTISEFGADTIIIRSEKAPEPVRYTYSKTTTYVDEAGNPVSMETVKSGLPVTVYYTTTGDRRVASRVVVHRTTTTAPTAPVIEKKTTTTTTTKKEED